MRFLHIADLHFGKKLNDLNMVKSGDQPYWAEKFIELVKEIKPDAVLIAGDVYDRSDPSEDAVELLDSFLTSLVDTGTQIIMAAGNHDSGKKLNFGSKLLKSSGIHIAGVLGEKIKPVTLTDEFGELDVWAIPYAFPALINDVLETGCRDYDGAFRAYLAAQNIDMSKRNVIVAHQNVAINGEEAIKSGSESMIAGVGLIDYTAFDGFEYVALGHIHHAQSVGRNEVRFAGSPLCYHFDESKYPDKGPVFVEIGAKGDEVKCEVKIIPPLHPVRIVSGSSDEILKNEDINKRYGEYIQLKLKTDSYSSEKVNFLRDLFAARGSRVLSTSRIPDESDSFGSGAEHSADKKDLDVLFAEFWQEQKGELPDEKSMNLISFIADKVVSGGNQKYDQQITDAIVKYAEEIV